MPDLPVDETRLRTLSRYNEKALPFHRRYIQALDEALNVDLAPWLQGSVTIRWLGWKDGVAHFDVSFQKKIPHGER